MDVCEILYASLRFKKTKYDLHGRPDTVKNDAGV